MIEVRSLDVRRDVPDYVRFRAEVRTPESRDELWWLVPDVGRPLTDDWLVGPALILGMARGQPVRVHGRVSRSLVEGIDTMQRLISLREEGLNPVPWEVDETFEPRESGGEKVLACFSLGLDSFHTALDPQANVDELLYLHGYEARLSDEAQLFRLLPSVKAAAAELGKPLRLAATNYWDLVGRHCRKSIFTLLPAVLGVGHLLGSHLSRLVLPANHDPIHEASRWECISNFIPLWNSGHPEVVQHGVASRIEKARALVASDTVMRWLRVCWATNGAAYNCGRCPKCVRTVVNLDLAGAPGRCLTLPATVDLRRVARMPIERKNHGDYVRENLVEAEAQGRDDLAAALRACQEGAAPLPLAWMASVRMLDRTLRRWGRSWTKSSSRRALRRHRRRHPNEHLFRSVRPARHAGTLTDTERDSCDGDGM